MKKNDMMILQLKLIVFNAGIFISDNLWCSSLKSCFSTNTLLVLVANFIDNEILAAVELTVHEMHESRGKKTKPEKRCKQWHKKFFFFFF